MGAPGAWVLGRGACIQLGPAHGKPGTKIACSKGQARRQEAGSHDPFTVPALPARMRAAGRACAQPAARTLLIFSSPQMWHPSPFCSWISSLYLRPVRNNGAAGAHNSREARDASEHAAQR